MSDCLFVPYNYICVRLFICPLKFHLFPIVYLSPRISFVSDCLFYLCPTVLLMSDCLLVSDSISSSKHPHLSILYEPGDSRGVQMAHLLSLTERIVHTHDTSHILSERAFTFCPTLVHLPSRCSLFNEILSRLSDLRPVCEITYRKNCYSSYLFWKKMWSEIKDRSKSILIKINIQIKSN